VPSSECSRKDVQIEIFKYTKECCLGAARYFSHPLNALSHAVGPEHGCDIVTVDYLRRRKGQRITIWIMRGILIIEKAKYGNNRK
jgi:hypothetical protein